MARSDCPKCYDTPCSCGWMQQKFAEPDCPKCLNSPCSCGWVYRRLNIEARIKQASDILGVKIGQLNIRVSDIIPKYHPMDDGGDKPF